MFNLSDKANEADAPTAQPQLAKTEAKLADALAINEKFHDVSAEVEQTKQALCAAEEGRSIEIYPLSANWIYRRPVRRNIHESKEELT
jgi:hypothetical protein